MGPETASFWLENPREFKSTIPVSATDYKPPRLRGDRAYAAIDVIVSRRSFSISDPRFAHFKIKWDIAAIQGLPV
jgi:hypothetical protein